MLTKAEFRELARARRAAIERREERSAEICQRLVDLPNWQAAKTVALYVDFRDEVQTGVALAAAWSAEKRVAVPWCRPDISLDLYALENRTELRPGKFGILEPPKALRADPARLVRPETVDLIVIPGLAFDRRGGRMGYGKGHYDRLIPQLRCDCWRVALAFDAQLFDLVPTEEHDEGMHVVVVESEVIHCV